jgi:hypothetical protein
MSWIPGWDSIGATSWWSGFFFWASIFCLIGLGIAEVASHRYSERRDDLIEIEQREIQRRHDEDMARVQHDTAQANERAAQLEKEAANARAAVAGANARAAEASQKAAEAQLALEKFKAPRMLTLDQQRQIAERVKSFNKMRFDLSAITGDPEALALSGQIADALKMGGWTWIEFNHPDGPFMTVFSFGSDIPNVGQQGRIGVDIKVHLDHAAELSAAANALSTALNDVGVNAKFAADADAQAGIPNHDTIHVMIGKKP